MQTYLKYNIRLFSVWDRRVVEFAQVRFSVCAEHINIGTQIARSFFCAFAWTDHLNTFFRQTQPGGSFVQIRKSETINVSDFITMLKSKH